MVGAGPSAADKAAQRLQSQQSQADLETAIQTDTRRTTRMRARTFGLGFNDTAANAYPAPTPSPLMAFRSSFIKAIGQSANG